MQRASFARHATDMMFCLITSLWEMGRKGGKGGSSFRSSPPGLGWECKQLRGFMGSITRRILKNLRATISEDKDKNFPE